LFLKYDGVVLIFWPVRTKCSPRETSVIPDSLIHKFTNCYGLMGTVMKKQILLLYIERSLARDRLQAWAHWYNTIHKHSPLILILYIPCIIKWTVLQKPTKCTACQCGFIFEVKT